jgi:hypothetical protein
MTWLSVHKHHVLKPPHCVNQAAKLKNAKVFPYVTAQRSTRLALVATYVLTRKVWHKEWYGMCSAQGVPSLHYVADHGIRT